MSMQRVYLNKQLLNKVLRGEESSKRRVGKIKVNRALIEKMLSEEKGDFFLSLFVATDGESGKFRYSPRGDMVFNAKPQKPREDQTGIAEIADDLEDHGSVWKD